MMENTANSPFEQSTALIFGGAKGIGRAVAVEWARRGARLAIADIDEAESHEAAAQIVANGGHAIGLHADVLSDSSVLEAIEATEAAFGDIDILMANVGAMLNGHPEDIPFSEWQRILDLNYLGAVRGISHILPKMLARRRGHIVTTASFAGLYPYAASRIPYAASKAAIIALTQNLAIYAEPNGVRASCLIPGPVATGILQSMTSWTEDCPMRMPGPGLTVKSVEEAAVTLSEGMRDGAILIPTHEQAWTTIQEWAASPDEFIRKKIREFELSTEV